MTDRELVQGIIHHDQAAFKELVETNQQLVIRTCYSLVHELEDARDLAQEVFIEILKSASSFRGNAKLSSWIYRIAINKSLNHLKRSRRREALALFSLQDHQHRINGEEMVDQNSYSEVDQTMEEKELKQALHTAINRLPVNQKIAFTLHNYEELPYKEIAEVMDLSVSSVESLIHRAKQNLQKRLRYFYHVNLK
ncbi:MAG: sigma-70 family RNA polymerase sigma factor [Bacteroidales bacterium]|nr:sigma-70 family RNA polymerase sigma factor [Bacteroidales bacterium]